MIRTLLADDEPLAREGLRVALASEPDIEIVGEAADGPSAVQQIRDLSPDLIFLDVQMPGLDGFQVLDGIDADRLPTIIFVMVYEQYAVRAFDADAVDYLLKPVDLVRLQLALQRARQHLAADAPGKSQRPPGEYLRRLTVRDGDRFLMLRMDEILWIEGAANYVAVHARGRSFLVRRTMGEIVEKLDPLHFARVHRSFIVNIDHIQEIKSSTHGDFSVVLVNGAAVPMSRSHHKRLLSR